MKNLEVYEKVCGDLKRTGDDWFMTNCPYPDHEDRKASFKINEAGYFSCFGCNARGDSYVFAKDFGYDPTPYARGCRAKGGNKSPSAPILPPKTGKMDNNSTYYQIKIR